MKKPSQIYNPKEALASSPRILVKRNKNSFKYLRSFKLGPRAWTNYSEKFTRSKARNYEETT